MATILAALFYLVITVHGEIRHQSGPMTADACALQMAFHIMQAKRIAAEYGSVVIAGRKVTIDDVEIECKPGERGT